MRALFGVIGLLVVVAIVGVLAKKQMSSVPAPPRVAAPGASAPAPATPQESVQQYKQAIDAAVQQPRAMPDDTK